MFSAGSLDSPNQLEAIWEFRFQAQALLADDLDAISSLSWRSALLADFGGTILRHLIHGIS
jgi:hypothetical protein